MPPLLNRLEKALIAAEKAVVFLSFVGLVAVLFLQVVYRFALSSPLDFSEELSRILVIWLAFVGAARAMALSEHFIVDFVVALLPKVAAKVVAWTVDAICLVFLATITWISLRTAIGGAGQTMPALQVSIVVQTLAMPVGFALMTVHALIMLLRRVHIGVPEPTPEAHALLGAEVERRA